ncbi:unnamed protein product, partial [Prorocentrum cordatum]
DDENMCARKCDKGLWLKPFLALAQAILGLDPSCLLQSFPRGQSEDLLAHFAAMANETYGGGIYQNPMNPKEIWANICENAQGNQLFPLWEPALGAYVSEGDYNKIMDALRSEFANTPPRIFTYKFAPICSATYAGNPLLSCVL